MNSLMGLSLQLKYSSDIVGLKMCFAGPPFNLIGMISPTIMTYTFCSVPSLTCSMWYMEGRGTILDSLVLCFHSVLFIWYYNTLPEVCSWACKPAYSLLLILVLKFRLNNNNGLGNIEPYDSKWPLIIQSVIILCNTCYNVSRCLS